MRAKAILIAAAATVLLPGSHVQAQNDRGRWTYSAPAGASRRTAFATARPTPVIVFAQPRWNSHHHTYTPSFVGTLMYVPPTYYAAPGGSTQRGVVIPRVRVLTYTPEPQYTVVPQYTTAQQYTLFVQYTMVEQFTAVVPQYTPVPQFRFESQNALVPMYRRVP